MEYSTFRSTSPATLHRRSLVDELQAGHRAAELLRRRLIRSLDTPIVDDLAKSDFDLAEAILNSFDNSIAIVNNNDPSRFSADDCKIEDSGDGGGDSSRTKDRRGCYKRRKRGQSWTVEGDDAADDCYAWRKYGQKMILNNKFPRNYYRCTHKTDQGCLAIKQVQRVSEDPIRYRTTYNGDHTCKNPLKASQITIPSSSPDQSGSSILLSFDRSSINNTNSPFFPPPSIKQEQRNNSSSQAIMNVMMMGMSQSSPSDYNNCMTGSDPAGDVISAGTYPGSASPPGYEIDNYMTLLGAQDHLVDLIQFDCDVDLV